MLQTDLDLAQTYWWGSSRCTWSFAASPGYPRGWAHWGRSRRWRRARWWEGGSRLAICLVDGAVRRISLAEEKSWIWWMSLFHVITNHLVYQFLTFRVLIKTVQNYLFEILNSCTLCALPHTSWSSHAGALVAFTLFNEFSSKWLMVVADGLHQTLPCLSACPFCWCTTFHLNCLIADITVSLLERILNNFSLLLSSTIISAVYTTTTL